MFRARLTVIAALALALSSCGGGSSSPTSSTLPDVKEAVRTQLDAIVTSYVNDMTGQMPTITSKVNAAEITACAKQRINQMIDSSQKQPNQPEAEFATMLLNQAQSSLYGIVGVCAQGNG